MQYPGLVSRQPPGGITEADHSLRDRLATGDESALAEVYDRHSTVVFGVALRVTGDRHAAEDVSQGVFLRLWRRPEAFDPARGSMRTWLCTLAHHAGVDWVRSECAARLREQTHGQDRRRLTVETAALVESAMSAELINLALNALPDHQRTPIHLAYFDGLTYRQVAEHLGIPAGTIKSRIRSGLQQMADVLHSQDVGHEM